EQAQPWQGLAEALPGLSLLSPRPLGLPAPAGGGAAPQAPLASQLISMLSLEQLSGGQAVDPAAFVAGRAEAVDVCKAAILGRITDLAGNPGSPAPAGRCLGTPVALAHTDRAPMDPERFRQRLQQLPGQAGESLLHQHRDNRDRAQNPQAPPKLPEELTQSTSTCRSMDHNLDEATGWFPPLGPVTNVLEHLCLLGWN
uniref:hypothetical protein n=1 Tax=Crossiella equi TaxID=130796 RepID=UPI0013020EFE